MTKSLLSLLLAIAFAAGVAMRVEAQAINSESATDMNPNDLKYLDQMDREGRGGQGQG
jgi:hypothetical protein